MPRLFPCALLALLLSSALVFAEELAAPPVILQSGAEFRPSAVDDGRVWSLSDLIDLAATQNIETRVAWEKARQAAAVLGIAESTFKPHIAAAVLAGFQHVSFPLPQTVLTPKGYFTADIGAVAPMLTLKWLLLDGGQRQASVNIAQQRMVAAQVGFTGQHQKLVFEVIRHYHSLNSLRAKIKIFEAAESQSQQLLAATLARKKSGMATEPDVLQAQQQLAQSHYQLTEVRAAESELYLRFLDIVGLAPSSQLNIAAQQPEIQSALFLQSIDALVKQALDHRPDLKMREAELNARTEEIEQARAEERPKLGLSVNAGYTLNTIGIEESKTLRTTQPQYGVMLSLDVPIFDGGYGHSKVTLAQSRRQEAQYELKQARDQAVREVWKTHNALKVAMNKRAAALAFKTAASAAYQAVFDSYRYGVASLIEVTKAHTDLIRAQASDEESVGLVQTASAALALATSLLDVPPAEKFIQ
ncbi:TolC family protein [uncultured Deefgea sp.]|uniref:TolC family protein n=1 Tax=uncultured Deefgea sp. TaxID=1304914 RepID=UPI00262403EC|nr:TolC family protein [uncultured Deefgea sp.]